MGGLDRAPGRRPRGGEAVYSPWLEITRTLTLGVSWQVVTQVRRVSPTGAPVALRVPLALGSNCTVKVVLPLAATGVIVGDDKCLFHDPPAVVLDEEVSPSELRGERR